MFGFWKKKKKPAAGQKPTRAEIIAQAQANARKARAELGEETIRKVAESFAAEQERKQEAARRARLDKALTDIRGTDGDKVADHIRAMIDDRDGE